MRTRLTRRIRPDAAPAMTEQLENLAHESAGFRERVTQVEVVETIMKTVYVIPPYGFIERLEISPKKLLPNMDASMPYRAEIKLFAPDGSPLDVLVEAIYRDVKS